VGLAKSVRRQIEGIGLPRRAQVSCSREYHGSQKFGWTICPDGLSSRSIAYSFGVGRNISFELSLIRRFGLQVYAFDPTPEVVRWLRARDLPEEFRFHPYGLSDFDGEAGFDPNPNPAEVSHRLMAPAEASPHSVLLPVRRLLTILAEREHDHIDILKMDIEGAEYAVIQDLARSPVPIGQILVEFHHRFPGLGRNATRQAIDRLESLGFRPFAVTPGGRECSFIRPPAD
jgi:FkbM family methyltransferase